MPSKYASGKYAIAECDRCGQRYKLKELKKEVIKTKLFNIKVDSKMQDFLVKPIIPPYLNPQGNTK